MRQAGILLAVSALPSRHGVGDFGSSCYELADFLKRSGFKIWQILPLNPVGYGNSPYQPYSSNAMDEVYISLDKLSEEGLLDHVPSFKAKAKSVDYETVRTFKRKYIEKAFKKFMPNKAYYTFILQEWVYPYAVFMTFKKRNGNVCWNEWCKEDQNWIKKKPAISDWKTIKQIELEMFIQFKLYEQWMDVKKYMNSKGIAIVGDMPFYVGIDSVDVWAHQDDFLLDKKGKPTYIAGVPPDYFSKTGQRWGNPIYNWKHMQADHFHFWMERLRSNADMFDMLRIDHFRAFDTYWKIKASCPTAIEGKWFRAPGYEFFDTLKKKLPDLKIIAEDLGDLRPQVFKLRDYYDLPGMKIVQFTFNYKGKEDFKDRKNMIVYTGTHDNDTIRGWYSDMSSWKKLKIREYFKTHGYNSPNISLNFVAFALDSVADTAIIPVQDFLNMSHEGRINTPGTLGSPNWEWKLDSFKKLFSMEDYLKKELKRSKR